MSPESPHTTTKIASTNEYSGESLLVQPDPDTQRALGHIARVAEIEDMKPEGVGLLTVDEYRSRRSETLSLNPEAELDEREEIQTYLDRQDARYVGRIRELAELEHPMNSDCRVVVIIPAYNEGSRIRQTLEQYVKQDVGLNSFEIVVFATPVENDTTPSEIERFKIEHPEVSVVFASQPWEEGEPATVGNGRKYGADIALARILESGKAQDTILVTNDADTLHIDDDYLSTVLAELDSNGSEDALVTELDIPVEARKKPNVAAAFYLLSEFEKAYATGITDDGKEALPEPALTNGRSTAIRSAAYAAIGGYNPAAVISEDWELGWMLADARNWDASRVSFLDKTKLTTDPRRFIDTVINRVPTDQQLLGFKDKPELRQLNNNEILSMVPDSFDWELFQDDIGSVWGSQFSGANKRIPTARFETIFSTTMKHMGIEYTVDNTGHVVLNSVDGFLNKISAISGESVEIVHSEQREYSPEMLKEIVEYFSGIPVGVIGSRQEKAKSIISSIQAAQSNGEVDVIPALQKELGRFQ